MNQIIKFIERDEILKVFPQKEYHYQHLLGFFRKSKDYVFYCSIIQEDDGTFEYYFNDNRDWAYSVVPENKFTTLQDCKEALIKKVEGMSCTPPSIWGFNVNEEARMNASMWKKLGITDEYPTVKSFSLSH